MELHVLGREPHAGTAAVRASPRARIGRKLARSPELRRALRSAISRGDIVHVHGLWLLPNLYPVATARHSGANLILSPRGMTSGWALRRRRAAKQFLWLVGQRRAFGDASLIHATSDLELDDVRRLGYGGPVAIVPNGVDVPTRRVRPGANRRRRIVSFGRLHEAKGNDVLLRAWAMLEGALTDWDLVIAGPDDGELPALQRLARDFGLERVEFQGPCYGEKRDALLAAADLLVLASRSENFGLVVAEALAAGTPVVTTRQTPWQALTRIGAGWWVEGTQGGLRDAIVEAAALSRTELAARGERGRVWVERELSWPVVAARMLRAYRWVRDGGPPPTDIDPGSRSWRVRWRLP